MATGIIKKLVETETAHIVREASSPRCKYSFHGHSYSWIFEIQGPIQSNGMVIDFIDLKPIKEFIDQFDHSSIFWSKEEKEMTDFFKKNFERVIIMKKNPTAENMARCLFHYIKYWLKNSESTVKSVEVFETRTGSAIALESDNDDIVEYGFVLIPEVK